MTRMAVLRGDPSQCIESGHLRSVWFITADVQRVCLLGFFTVTYNGPPSLPRALDARWDVGPHSREWEHLRVLSQLAQWQGHIPLQICPCLLSWDPSVFQFYCFQFFLLQTKQQGTTLKLNLTFNKYFPSSLSVTGAAHPANSVCLPLSTYK